MQAFLGEFKKFINRGNVVDMAVGIIVGSSFTAIVNALSNNILKPVVNYLLSLLFDTDSLTELYTFLKKVEIQQDVLNDAGERIGTETVPDLTQSIYLDWGAFLNAVLSFFLIATVLFIIVKTINKIRSEQKEFARTISDKTLDHAERKELRAANIKIRDKEAVTAYFAQKKRLADEAAAAKAASDAEKARLQREANPTSEDLLKEILAELKKKA